MKSNNEFEKIDQRSICSHYALYASGTNPTWLKKKTPRLLEIQNTLVEASKSEQKVCCAWGEYFLVRRRNRPIQFTQNRWSKLIHKNT